MKFVLGAFLTVFFLNATLLAQELVEFDYELDAYYTNVSAFIDLDKDNELTDATNQSEIDIYSNLMAKSWSPNIFLVEAAVYPMSVFGLYFRKTNEDLYTKAKLQDYSLVKALTAGFEEPYAFSFFVGRMVVFKNSERFEDEHIGKNRAYIGYLVSVGDYSIVNNLVYYNKWVNFEYKLKGTREQADRDLDWSFRIGYKANANEDFLDTIYVGARRSSTDYKRSPWLLQYNSAFNLMLESSAKDFYLTGAEATIEKKFPISWNDKISAGIEIGYLYVSSEKYSGVLRDDGVDNHQLILRPNLKF